MTSYQATIFDTAANGDTGIWVYVGNLDPEFSLHVYGLESDGSLKIYLVNNSKFYAPATPTDDTAALFTTINGAAAPSITPVTMSAGWLQIVKTPGVTPTDTVVKLAGRQF